VEAGVLCKGELDVTQHPITFQDRVRKATGAWLAAAGMALHRTGVHPDVITIAGTLVVVLAAVLIAQGQFQTAGIVLILGLPLDALDGAVARAMQRKDRRGGVLDSTLDRLADGLLFGGLAYYFASQSALDYMLLALTSLIASFMVSYVRARAGEAGLAVKIGLLDRLVRLLLLMFALLVPSTLIVALWVMAIGSIVTALQRLLYVYQHLDREV
jgi:CDP-diacylglycerol--glycerol-3-phosphate 3-phosphatidyltransferase